MSAPGWLTWAWAAFRLTVVPISLIALAATGFANLETKATAPIVFLMAAGLAVNQAALTLFAARMWLLLSAFKVGLAFWQAVRIHIQSVFYFFIVPMTVGLELARLAKIKAVARAAPASDIAAALLLDRMIGAASAGFAALALWPFVTFDAARWAAASSGVLWVFSAALLAGATALAFAPVRVWAVQTARIVFKNAALVGGVAILSGGMHLLFATGVWLLARAIGIEAGLIEIAFAVCAGMLLIVAPISIGGAGAADVAVVAIFVTMGFDLNDALVLGALCYVARLTAAVQGGLWEMLEGGRDSLRAFQRHAAGASAALDGTNSG